MNSSYRMSAEWVAGSVELKDCNECECYPDAFDPLTPRKLLFHGCQSLLSPAWIFRDSRKVTGESFKRIALTVNLFTSANA